MEVQAGDTAMMHRMDRLLQIIFCRLDTAMLREEIILKLPIEEAAGAEDVMQKEVMHHASVYLPLAEAGEESQEGTAETGAEYPPRTAQGNLEQDTEQAEEVA